MLNVLRRGKLNVLFVAQQSLQYAAWRVVVCRGGDLSIYHFCVYGAEFAVVAFIHQEYDVSIAY